MKYQVQAKELSFCPSATSVHDQTMRYVSLCSHDYHCQQLLSPWWYLAPHWLVLSLWLCGYTWCRCHRERHWQGGQSCGLEGVCLLLEHRCGRLLGCWWEVRQGHSGMAWTPGLWDVTCLTGHWVKKIELKVLAWFLWKKWQTEQHKSSFFKKDLHQNWCLWNFQNLFHL